MSDMESRVDDLLAADTVDPVKLIPTGGWKSELLSVSKKSPKAEDAKYKYRILLTFEPQEPDETVDEAEANAYLESEDAEGARLFQTYFVHNKRDVLRVKRALENMGFTQSIEQAIEEVDGGLFAVLDVGQEYDDYVDDEVNVINGIRFDV